MKGSVITNVLVIAIIIASAIIAVNMINPTIQEGQSLQTFNDAKKTMETIDSAIIQVFFEAPGSRRVVDVNIPKGKLSVVGGEESVKLRLDDLKLFQPGIRTQDGNILVTSGAQVNSYEEDTDNDGSTDLVVENSAVKFAVRKIGSAGSPALINTSDIITLIRNRRTGTDIWHPKSAIYINESARSTYGVGYTELTQTSDFISSSGVHIFVNATDANMSYDAVFTLGPSQDFMEFYVTHVIGV
ncbi:MAG TPA: hypothetical protein VJI12_01220 [archaeon]|nr:hypothetical protein [archaeon]